MRTPARVNAGDVGVSRSLALCRVLAQHTLFKTVAPVAWRRSGCALSSLGSCVFMCCSKHELLQACSAAGLHCSQHMGPSALTLIALGATHHSPLLRPLACTMLANHAKKLQ